MTEQQHQTADQVTQIITAWLKDICPIAIKSFDGGFVTADAGRVAHYIALNHGGVYSDQSLNDAVMNLWNVLTKFSTKEEDCQFRGRYATRPEPPRDPYANLSAEKLRQAGLKRISDGRVVPMASEDYASIQTHNHREDSKPKTQQELLQAAARSMLATQAGYKSWDDMPEEARENLNPWKQKAEALYVPLRNGKIDGRMTDDLRNTFVRRGNRIDWELTYAERKKILERIDNIRNHDFRFTSKSVQ